MRLAVVVLICCVISPTIGQRICISRADKNAARTVAVCQADETCWRPQVPGSFTNAVYGCGTSCSAGGSQADGTDVCTGGGIEGCNTDYCNIETNDYVCAADSMPATEHIVNSDKTTWHVCNDASTKTCTIVLPKNADESAVTTTCGNAATTCTSNAAGGCLECEVSANKAGPCNDVDKTKFKECYTGTSASQKGSCPLAVHYPDAADGSTGEYAPRCERPLTDAGVVAGVGWSCGLCTGTTSTVDNCKTCTGDLCNLPVTCAQYTYSASTFSRATSAECFTPGCNKPLSNDKATNVGQSGCGKCSTESNTAKCVYCETGDKCNSNNLDCVEWVRGSSETYSADKTTQECAIEAKCSRPFVTYGGEYADTTTVYKCGKCGASTEKTCVDCDDKSSCNVKPAGDTSKKCHPWTWSTEDEAYKAGTAVACDLGDNSALVCAKPKDAAVKADFAEGKGCGECPVADKCTVCSTDSCNSGVERLTFTLVPIVMTLYFLW